MSGLLVQLIYLTHQANSLFDKSRGGLEMESQFKIKMHAQVQNFDGKEYQFQPEHLLCEKCWEAVDTAFAHASYYGSSRSSIQEAFQPRHDHAITVTKVK
jgi:hypothetical protein